MTEVRKFSTLPKDLDLAESFDVFMVNEYSLPSFAVRFLKEHAPSYKAREDDVYVISYPKTGTTWTQEIVYLLCSNLNFECASSKPLMERFPYIEHASCDFSKVKELPSVIDGNPLPRLLKSHYPYSLLPADILKKKCKIIYVTRNPKDVVVSYYHFACWLNETRYQGTFSQFFERFMQNRTTYSPFLLHNLEFWNQRNDPNILFLFYEDMQKDPINNVEKIVNFLGKSLPHGEIIKVMEHCSFRNMSERHTSPEKSSSKFFRKGEVGDWKNYFSADQNSRMEEWIEQVLQGSGLQYTYEL